jgi:hypothetical protein
MKSKNVALLCVFIFCLFIVMFCQTDEKEIHLSQTPEELTKLIHVSNDAIDLLTEQARTNLIDKIIEFRDSVQNSFLPGKLDDPALHIGSLLEKQNVILEDSTRIYRRVRHWGQFYELFRMGKIEKAKELGVGKDKIELYIEFTHITVDKIEEDRVGPEGQALNLIARVIFKYHIREMGHPLSKNQAGGGTGEFLHRNICTWI